jgi:cytochrome c5
MRWLFVALFTTAAALAAGQNSNDADAAGKALVNGICSSCHGADLTTAKQSTRKEWQDVVDRMKSYGAALDEKQTTILLDYLEKNHGPKQAAPPTGAAGSDEGKKLLDNFCTGCHDLDLVTNRGGGAEAEWKEIVDRMNGRGAGVPEKDIPVLVGYLVKTYPKK